MTSRRVLHVIGGGDTGGAMAYLLPLLTALRTEECDANLLCLGSGGLAVEAAGRGLPCEVLPMSGPWDVRVLPGLRRYLAAGGWEVVHTHGMRANLPVRTILRAMRRRPALFTTIHSDLALDYSHAIKSWGYVALDRFSAGTVDGFFCVSADLAGGLAARGVPKSQIRVVYPGIEPVDPEAQGATVLEFFQPSFRTSGFHFLVICRSALFPNSNGSPKWLPCLFSTLRGHLNRRSVEQVAVSAI